ncbi:MAG: hypothetical protein J6J36_05865 [Clostridia bacterium]|nr:hypothetical protein [Clostridia bacterium]
MVNRNKALAKIGQEKKIKKFINMFFSRAKVFFVNHNSKENNNDKKEIEDKNINSDRSQFLNSIKVKEIEKSELLVLQRKFRNGEIKEEDLTKEQIDLLCALYDKQIEQLENKNKIKKQKIAKWNLKV